MDDSRIEVDALQKEDGISPAIAQRSGKYQKRLIAISRKLKPPNSSFTSVLQHEPFVNSIGVSLSFCGDFNSECHVSGGTLRETHRLALSRRFSHLQSPVAPQQNIPPSLAVPTPDMKESFSRAVAGSRPRRLAYSSSSAFRSGLRGMVSIGPRYQIVVFLQFTGSSYPGTFHLAPGFPYP